MMKPTFLFLTVAVLAADLDQNKLDQRKLHAQSLLTLQDYAAALTEAKAIQKERPDDIAAYQLVASAQMGLGDYDEAEESIQWMLDLRIGKADTNGWLLVARFREVTGDIEGALDAVNLAYSRLETAQKGPDLLAYAGHLHLLAGHLALAEKAVGDKPSVTLARIRLRQGRREDAIQILTQLQQDSAARFLLAELTGDYTAIEKNGPEYVLYLAGPGKDPQRALNLAVQLTAKRRDVFALDALAMAQFANGDLQAAKTTMQKLIAVGTRDPRIAAHLVKLGPALGLEGNP